MRGREGKGDIRFSTTISVVVLVLISGLEVFGIQLLDLSIGHVVANTRVQLIQGLPLQLVVFLRQVASGGDGAFEGRSPDGQRMIFTGL